MRVVVEKKPYKGRAVGTEITLPARDARVLIALGLMAPAAEAVVVVEPEPEQPAPQKRVYRRRDLTAED